MTRLEKIRVAMQEKALDALLVTSNENRRLSTCPTFFTNTSGSSASASSFNSFKNLTKLSDIFIVRYEFLVLSGQKHHFLS